MTRVFGFRCLLGLSLACLGGSLWAQRPYTITDYAVEMELRRDGLLAVEERISVRFDEPRRGIIRSIPFDYRTGKGVARRVILRDVAVTDEQGTSLTTKVSRERASLSIRIGDPDVFLPAGSRKTYVIRYSAQGALNWFEKSGDWEPYCELYWNLTGDQVDTEIGRFRFRVRFPKIATAGRLRARLFVGPYGATQGPIVVGAPKTVADPATSSSLTLTDSSLQGTVAASLPPFHGATMVLNLPADAVQRPSLGQSAQAWLMPNLGFGIPLLVLAAMSFLLLRFGRDPASGPMVVHFEPPLGLSGSELGAFLDQKADTRDLVAGIFTLAVRGFLTIHPEEKGLVFKKRTAQLRWTGKEPSGELGPFEAELLAALRRGGKVITEADLRNHVAAKLGALKSALFGSLVGKGLYAASPHAVAAAWLVGGGAAIVLMAILAAWISPFGDPLPSFVGAAVGFLVLVPFARLMPKRTVLGARTLAQARGFEEFLRRARSKEFEWMDKVQPTAALFEEYLPHAVALGLTEQWASAFTDIVREPPTWYVAPHGQAVFNPVFLASDLDVVGRAIGTAATTLPRSSGASGGHSGFSSGGGFSGGGFGGGGTSSW
ncbi:MAG: DUF2207 domain-containing protein [Fimbriimonadales bacterium]|nr:DUF2207 domain-containing protein [Fimbriimonadales bacterium]